MRAIIGIATALVLCLVLAKKAEGTGRAYAGAPYKYDNKYDNKYGNNYGSNRYNGYGNYYGYGNRYPYNYGNRYYPYKYGPPSRPGCRSYQSCYKGYYFDKQTCSCVPLSFVQLPPAPPPRPIPLPQPLPPVPVPPQPPQPPRPPSPPQCLRTRSSCPVPARQQVNLATCTCECIEYRVIIPGRPGIPAVPGRFTGTRGTRRGSRRRGSNRSSRDVGLEVGFNMEDNMMEEFEDRSRRSGSSNSGSSKSGSSSSRGGRGRSPGRVYVPGRPAVPPVPPREILAPQCPARQRPVQSTCTCQ